MVVNLLIKQISFFLKFEFFKNYCFSTFVPIIFQGLELGYWIASRDTEMILKILISQNSATFR